MARASSSWKISYAAPKQAYEKHMFCRPRLYEPRGSVPDEVWEAIWPWVPANCRVFDPHLIYTPVVDGTSLRTCLEKCKKCRDAAMCFFVYSEFGDILGGFSPVIWARTSGYLDLMTSFRAAEDAFVFRRLQGKSTVDVFTWTGANQMLMQASELHGLIFGGDDAAVHVNKDLTRATSSASRSFSSPPLLEENHGESKVARHRWTEFATPSRFAGTPRVCESELTRTRESCTMLRWRQVRGLRELKTVVQRELILNTAKDAEDLVEMSTGAEAMLTNRRYDELKLMYRIFKREPTMLPHIITAMEPYIEGRARGVVEDPQMIDSPAAYMEKVLELKKEVDDMVVSCFDSDTEFQKGRNRGLEAVLNKDTRCAKYLALFCDMQLKKGLKGRNEEEVQTLVNQVVSLFAHLKDKDIFLDIYKSALSRRLLNKLSVSNDAEDCFITKLKVECGQQSIQKLASMFTDMALSDQLQEEYMKASHSGSPGGVTHEVRVLQTNAWPEKAHDVPVIPCPEMTTCITAYEAFYNSKHNGRKLRWIYNMGSVELKCYGLARPHILVVSAYQCLALVLFNQRQQVTLREICEATKLPEEESRRQVTSLTVSRHKVLLHDATGKDLGSETKLQVNDKFANEKVKVAVSLIKKEEKAETTTLAEAPVERKHVIDAAIVRIMKSRNRLEHNSLLDEVFRQCTLFKPQPAQIKSQIEHLIEREFLKRDDANRSIYLYLRRESHRRFRTSQIEAEAGVQRRPAKAARRLRGAAPGQAEGRAPFADRHFWTERKKRGHDLAGGCAAFPPGLCSLSSFERQLKPEEKMSALLDAKTAGLMQYMLLGEHCEGKRPPMALLASASTFDCLGLDAGACQAPSKQTLAKRRLQLMSKEGKVDKVHGEGFPFGFSQCPLQVAEERPVAAVASQVLQIPAIFVLFDALALDSASLRAPIK
ncbi:CUL3A, partial [Symbiodinium sp. CCMP2456]